MNIRELLKKYNIGLSTLANNLFISRPTLNTYISLYEKNVELPSKKYQLIFNKLFRNEKTPEEFYETLNGCNKLLAKDEIFEMTDLSPEHSDLISYIVEDIKKDLIKEKPNENIYSFIRLVINHYRKFESFVDISNYFLTINTLTEYNSLSTKEKKKILCYYNFFRSLNNNCNINFKEVEKSFLNEINKRKKGNQQNENNLKRKIEELISQEINKEIVSGKPIDEININEIIRRISNRINGS